MLPQYKCKPWPETSDLPASVAHLDAPSDWRPGGRRFNPRRGRQHSFVEIDHEIFSTVILSLPLIQEGQLSVSGERMCTILVNRLEDQACTVNVWLGKLTALDMTPLGWLGRKTSTRTKKDIWSFDECINSFREYIYHFRGGNQNVSSSEKGCTPKERICSSSLVRVHP